jgi:hypothetical protein
MSVQGLIVRTPGAGAMPAARLIALIGLTLALGFIVVVAGAWVGGAAFMEF